MQKYLIIIIVTILTLWLLAILFKHIISTNVDNSTINYIDRESGDQLEEAPAGEDYLKFLYRNRFGKLTLNGLIKKKFFSNFWGWVMNRKYSRKHIAPFIRKNNIDTTEFLNPIESYETFNQFFYRKLKKDARPIGEGLVSPADGKIIAFSSIDSTQTFFIKGDHFNLFEFIQSDTLAKKYDKGTMVIVRLAPTDYHRFHFPASGKISKSTEINGSYFSVSPIALDRDLEIFCENVREYSILESDHYGDILISEIGATMVGSIIQTYSPNSNIKKGEEKGYFEFGGSTVVMFFEKGKVTIDDDILKNSRNQLETYLKMGSSIGQKAEMQKN